MNKAATLYDIVFYAVGGCCISDVSLVESETSIVFVHFVFALFNEVCEVVFMHHLLNIDRAITYCWNTLQPLIFEILISRR